MEAAFAGRGKVMAFFDFSDKGLHFFGDGRDEIGDFALRAFRVKQDASVGKITHCSRDLVFAGDF